MEQFIISKLIMLVTVIPATIILLRIFFKKSFFRNIGLTIVLSNIIASINTEARFAFESYTQAYALPIGIIVIATVIIISSRVITGSLNNMVKTIQELASGNLQIRVSEKISTRNDEIGMLGTSVNQMVKSYKSMHEQLKVISHELEKNSQKMLGITQELKAAGDMQSASIEEISASVEEIASVAEQNSNNAERTKTAVVRTEQAIKESSSATFETITKMKKVIKHVSVIDDIAWQTGILSLNASIEAANAGQAGKSFTVVAENVRKLADHSSVTAREIGSMSSDMLTVSEKAGKELQEIVAQTEQTNTMVAEIIESAVQQSSGVNLINASLQEMSNMIMKNKEFNEHIASVSAQMNNNIDTINQMLKQFR